MVQKQPQMGPVDQAEPGPVPVLGSMENAGDEAAMKDGGYAILQDGEINTRRFSLGPEREVAFDRWNLRVAYEVRREPTNHQVVVAEVTQSLWRTHIIVAMAAAGLVLAGLVFVGSLGLGYALVLGGVFALMVYGLVSYEHRVLGSAHETGEIVIMDTVIWEELKKLAVASFQSLPGRERAAYRTAVKEAKAAHRQQATQARDQGKPAPEYEAPDKDDWISTGKHKVGMAELIDRMRGHLTESSQQTYHRRLVKNYRRHPEQVEMMGRGVRRCGCVACLVAAQTGQVSALSGVEAARVFRGVSVQAASPDMKARFEQLRSRRRAEAAARALAQREQRLARQQEKEQERRRRETARDYLAGMTAPATQGAQGQERNR